MSKIALKSDSIIPFGGIFYMTHLYNIREADQQTFDRM